MSFFYQNDARRPRHFLENDRYVNIALGFGQSGMGGRGEVSAIPVERTELAAPLTGVRSWDNATLGYNTMEAGVNTQASSGFDFGVEPEFCYQLNQQLLNKGIASGIYFDKWFRGGTQLNLDPVGIDLHPDSVGETFSEFVTRIEAIKAYHLGQGKVPYFFASLLYQGESDADTTEDRDAYASNLQQLYHAIYQATRIPGYYTPPPVFGLVRIYDSFTYSASIRADIENHSAWNPNAFWVNADDAPDVGDSQHANTEGLILIGGRLAQKMSPLLGLGTMSTLF